MQHTCRAAVHVYDVCALQPHAGSRWAEPSESHLRLLMAHVSGSEAGRRGAMARGAAARRRVLERYSMAAAAGRLSQTLRRIEAATAPAATRDVMRVGEGNGSLR